jgi:hypothetical protein
MTVSPRAGVRPVALVPLVLLLLLVLCARARIASAQGLEGRPLPSSSSSVPSWELGGRASYLAPPIHGGSNPFGAGFGARLGLSTSNVYVGVTVIDYLGSQDVDLTTHSLLYGGEVGYGFSVATGTGVFFTVRPEAGVGGLTLFYTTPNARSAPSSSATVKTRANVDVITTASASSNVVSSGSSSGSSGGSSSSSSVSDTTTVTVSNIYFQPGVTVMFSSASSFVGVKGSMLLVPGIADGAGGTSTWLTYGVEGELGFRF